MSVLAVVPARGGSKSIKYKNIIDVYDRPLIYYVLNELLLTPGVDKVVVSTDNAKIKNAVVNLFDHDVGVLDRPAEIADDVATSEAVVDHAIINIERKYDYTMLVQCTSPLTKAKDFTNLIRAVEDHDSAAFYVEDCGLFFDEEGDMKLLRAARLPRQVRAWKKKEVGNAWIFKTDGFLKHGSRLFGKIGLCEIEPPKDIEIDDIGDVEVIECILKRRDECLTT